MPEKGKETFLKTGLASVEAAERLKKFGKNELKKKKEVSVFKLLLSQFKSPLVYVLLLAGLVTFFLREWTDSVVIFAAVLINTSLGFWQERKAQKSLVALRSLLAQKTKVIRDGQQKTIDATEVIPGDLVILTIGTRVPADGILLEATDLSINEAILTGESMPVEKTATHLAISKLEASFLISPLRGKILDEGDISKVRSAVSLPKKNQVFMGTNINTGIAKVWVTKTGMTTEMGKIGKKVTEVEEEKTPLQVQLGKLAKILAIVVGVFSFFLFFTGEFLGYEILEMFTTSVAVAVAAIPEGLVVTLTVILALGMQRILKRKAIVRKLLAAETLGSVSVICADKTGTLTEGEMRVVEAVTRIEQEGKVGRKEQEKREGWLVKAAVLCNDMRDPLEVGMMEWAQKKLKIKNEKVKILQEQYPRVDEIPFSPKYKYIATLHSQTTNNRRQTTKVLFFSGAPEVILRKCKMEKGELKNWEKKFKEYGEKGYRLVGFAYKKLQGGRVSKIQSKDLDNFEWLGILIYEDPVRKGVKAVLKECQGAGIGVKVITGDYASTALAVLDQLDLKIDPKIQVLTGEELEKVSETELRKKVGSVVLFARTNPEQKLKIVQALKENDEVVAMTGDGVNDAPALKQADIGVVVGEASDVAKEVADIVLLDSNFATIVHAIEEGRNIFENIKKVVLYLLSDSFTEVILIGGSILFGLPLPVTAAQILWVNLIEDTLPGLALAFEEKEEELMLEPPRPRNAPILDVELKTLIFIIGISTDLILFGLFYWLLRGFLHLHYLQTVMFVALGLDSLFYVFACRSLRKSILSYHPLDNKFLTVSVLVGFFFLTAAVYFPPLQLLLKTHSLGIHEWLFLLGLGLFNLLTIELTKWLFIVRHKNAKIEL